MRRQEACCLGNRTSLQAASWAVAVQKYLHLWMCFASPGIEDMFQVSNCPLSLGVTSLAVWYIARRPVSLARALCSCSNRAFRSSAPVRME